MTALKDITCSVASKIFHGQVTEGFEREFQRLAHLIPDQAKPGQTIQVGFSCYRLEPIGDQQIGLLAQDFSKNPWQDWTTDLTRALYCQREQVLFNSLIGFVPEDSRFDDKIVLAKGVLDVDNYYLHKSAGSWFIGYQDRDNSDLQAIYAYQLLELKPPLVKRLNLPDEYLVTVSQGKISAVVDEQDCLVYGG